GRKLNHSTSAFECVRRSPRGCHNRDEGEHHNDKTFHLHNLRSPVAPVILTPSYRPAGGVRKGICLAKRRLLASQPPRSTSPPSRSIGTTRSGRPVSPQGGPRPTRACGRGSGYPGRGRSMKPPPGVSPWASRERSG